MEKIEAIYSSNERVGVVVIKKQEVRDVEAIRTAKTLLIGEVQQAPTHPAEVHNDDRWDEEEEAVTILSDPPWRFIAIGYFFIFLVLSSISPALAAAYVCIGFLAYFSPSFFDDDLRMKTDWRYVCFPWMAYQDYARARKAVKLYDSK